MSLSNDISFKQIKNLDKFCLRYKESVLRKVVILNKIHSVGFEISHSVSGESFCSQFEPKFRGSNYMKENDP